MLTNLKSTLAIENVRETLRKEKSDEKIVMNVMYALFYHYTSYILLISIRFYKDSTSKSYERQVFGILDVFGNIGGVKEILEIAGALIVGLFSRKIFIFTLLSSLYQVDSSHIGK